MTFVLSIQRFHLKNFLSDSDIEISKEIISEVVDELEDPKTADDEILEKPERADIQKKLE